MAEMSEGFKKSTYAAYEIEPKNHRMAWVGRKLKVHPVPPCAVGRAAPQQLLLFGLFSSALMSLSMFKMFLYFSCGMAVGLSPKTETSN